RWFTGMQHLYDANYANDVYPGWSYKFDVSEGSSTDRADLESLTDANAGGTDGWWERMQPVADMVELTRAFAAEHYAGHWDSYSVGANAEQPNNYALYSAPAGRFSLIPSGTDQTWLEHVPFGVYGNAILMHS